MTVETSPTIQSTTDLDNPWKYAFDYYFRDFMEYCLPDIAEHIDWEKSYLSLDKELQKITQDAAIGTRVADKLFKVWQKNGQETWILLHIEVQGRYEKAFPERMLVYRYRIRDRYHKPVISLALLIDNNTNWRPDSYQESCHGTTLQIQYRVVKLLDYRDKRQELESMHNPFSMIIFAQLAAMETQNNPHARLQVKTALTRQLFQKGLKKKDIAQLFHLLDWLIQLPPELMLQYEVEVTQIEEETHVKFMNTFERIGFKQGWQEGRQEGGATFLIKLLERRFQSIPVHYLTLIQQADNETLLLWGGRLLDAASLEDIFK